METEPALAGLAGGYPDLASIAVTIVRLPFPPHSTPPERVISTVGRVNLALADELHSASDTRFYSTARRQETLDVYCFRDDLAGALLSGESAARLVRRLPLRDLGRDGGHPTMRVAFETPTLFRVAGYDHLLPNSGSVFDSLRVRWLALDWPALPEIPSMPNIPCYPEQLRYARMPGANGLLIRGFVGVVRYQMLQISEQNRAALWLLARFGELRGVGRSTSYGLGRMRILELRETWRP